MEQKEQNKNPTVSPKEEKPKTPLTEEQRQKRRKMLVYPLMGLLFAGSMSVSYTHLTLPTIYSV